MLSVVCSGRYAGNKRSGETDGALTGQCDESPLWPGGNWEEQKGEKKRKKEAKEKERREKETRGA